MQTTTVIEYRQFRNTDPPGIVEIWRGQAPGRGLAQPMSVSLFDQLVLAKPYFDKEGLIVATDEGKPVGYVHAAFGPTDDEKGISRFAGVTSMLMVKPAYRRQGIGAELLRRGEDYLRSHGAQVLYAGGIRPLNGFYLGLYGGSELPGVLDEHQEAQKLFLAHGYREIDRSVVATRDLQGFRPLIDRKQLQLRRKFRVEVASDPPRATWWSACTTGCFDSLRFSAVEIEKNISAGHANFWPMIALGVACGVHTAGLSELEVAPEYQRQGVATFLLGEAFRELQNQSVHVIETQTMQRNTAARALYAKLGFKEIDGGAVYRKDAG